MTTLANLGGRATLVVDGRGIDVADGRGIDVADASTGEFGPDLRSVYDHWTSFTEFASGGVGDGATSPIDEAALGPPSPEPRQVFAIGLNYKSHAEESGMELPAIPATFTKYPTCITGPFSDVVLSGGSVDWEVELVAVIGGRAEHVSESDGWDHVAGLTVGQDLSDRHVQFAAGAQFALGKSYPGYGPTGPWLVTPDELADPGNLALGCSVDGEVVQDARTDDLVFDVPRLVAEISAVVPMLPGDVIFTGTPAGVGFTRTPARLLRPGEVLESWIEGIGVIRNRLVAGTA